MLISCTHQYQRRSLFSSPLNSSTTYDTSFPLIAIAIVYCNCSSSSPKILTSWSKKLVVTDGREIGALTTSNLLAGVSGRTAIVRISSGMMEGCVVLAVPQKTGGKLDILRCAHDMIFLGKVSPFTSFSIISFTVQTTSNPLLGTVSGRVTLVMEVAVLLLKMTGCVVQDAQPRPGGMSKLEMCI